MRGILITLFSVTALASAATVDHVHHVRHRMTGSSHVNKVNSDPSKAPAICKAKDSEGVLVAHEYCNKFYKCSHGKPVALRCPKDLLYSPEHEYCDWRKDVDCGNRIIPDKYDGDHDNGNNDGDETDCSNINDDPSLAPAICAQKGSDGILVAHENCTQYYQCSKGRPVARNCPSGLLYNPKKKTCDWPKHVDCGNRTIPEDDGGCDGGHNGGNGNGEDNNNNHGNGTCNCNPNEAPKICAQNANSSNVLIAHERCNKYYQCLHGRPVARKCPKNLLYNPYLEICDWPKNVQCDDRVIPEHDDDDDNDNDSDEDEKEDNYGHSDPSEAPAICAEKKSDGVLIAHELCNYFYICLHGRPFPVACPAGLHYNYKRQQCDWPKNVKCRGRIVPDDKDDKEHKVTEKEKDIYGDSSKAPKICAKKGSDGILVAHEKCNRFYQCSGGKPVTLTCPRNLLYNPNIAKCDWPHNVICGDRFVPRPKDDDHDDDNEVTTKKPIAGHDDPSKAPVICSKEGSDGILVANEHCNKFYSCSGGIPVVLKCPKGLFYNPKKEECDWPKEVTCGDRIIPDENEECDEEDEDDKDHHHHINDDPSKAPEICAKHRSDGVLVAHEYCNKYYICVNKHPFPMKCPKNLRYNPRKKVCDWPQNVNCRGRIIPKDKDVKDNCTNERGRMLNLFQGYYETRGYDDPSKAHIICAKENSTELLIAHEYCNQFYQCVNGHPIAMSCPPSLYFDPKLQKCDWPSNVNCRNRYIPEDIVVVPDSGEDPNGHESNNHDDPSKAPEICAEEDSDGVYVAHKYCNKYYVCVNRIPVPLKCPDILLYSPKLEACDWPWNVKCNSRKKPSDDHHEHNEYLNY